jgi:hypothetical protein
MDERHIVELVTSTRAALLLSGELDMVVLTISDHCAPLRASSGSVT